MTKTIIKISISVLLLTFLLWKSDLSSLWNQIADVNLFTLVVSMAAYYLGQALSSLRWQWILNEEGVSVSFKYLFVSYMTGMFVNNFMPTSIGGDVVKTYDIYRLTKNSSLSFFSVFFERFSGLIALVLLSWLGISRYFFIFPSAVLVGWLAINIAIALVILCFAYRAAGQWILQIMQNGKWDKVMKIPREMLERLLNYQKKKGLLRKLIFISFPIQLIIIMIYWQIALSIGVSLPFSFYLFSVPLITVISLAPISFGGLGVREGLTVMFFSTVGIAKEAALSISLIFLAITYLVSLLGGLFIIFSRGTSLKKPQISV